jgi:hypothetical protein
MAIVAVLAGLASVALILLVLLDGFEAMVLPRRVTRPYRPTRLYYRFTWMLWRLLAGHVQAPKKRETFLSLFGPLSLLGLFGTWVLGLILAFAGLQWALDELLLGGQGGHDFAGYLYLSGGTFFTVGYADATPATLPGRALAVVEAGMGFAFLAVVIGYLPVLYQSFSRREVTISLLDARAGSPPSAAEFLRRLATGSADALAPFLAEWERWAGELLESHLSYPVLSFYRSQHDNQSWLAALTAMLDICALLIVGVKCEEAAYQARLTFAMARHAAVDLALVFRTPPVPVEPDRLPPERLDGLWAELLQAGLPLHAALAVRPRLAELRGGYEPFVNALAGYFLFALPAVVPEKSTVDNWQTSAWTRRMPGIAGLPAPTEKDDHFD